MWLGLAGAIPPIDGEPGAIAACPARFLLPDLGLVDRDNLAVAWRDPLEGIHGQSLPQCLRKRTHRGTGGAIHRQSGDTIYLDRSVRIYEWTRGALRGADGLYADPIAPDGPRMLTIWSYNQGSMIGAGVLLARETNDPSFLEHAAETAGAYVDSRDVAALMTQDPAFNAVLFRNLLVLDQVRPDDRYRSSAAQNSSAMWASKRLPQGFLQETGHRSTTPQRWFKSMPSWQALSLTREHANAQRRPMAAGVELEAASTGVRDGTGTCLPRCGRQRGFQRVREGSGG